MAQMRNSFRKLKQDGKNILDAENLLNDEGGKSNEGANIKRAGTIGDDGVGEMADIGEFGLGIAPRGSKPVNKIELTKEKEAEIAEAQAYEEYEVSERVTGREEASMVDELRAKSKISKRKPIDKQSAFLEYK